MDELSQSVLIRLASLWPGAWCHVCQFGRDGALTISITNHLESEDTLAIFTEVTLLQARRSWTGHTLKVRSDGTMGQYIVDDPDSGFALRFRSVGLAPCERPYWLKQSPPSAEVRATLNSYASRRLHIAPETVAELSRGLDTLSGRFATMVAYTFSLPTVTLKLSAADAAPLYLVCRHPSEYRGPTSWRIGRLQAELTDPPTSMRITDAIAGASVTCYSAAIVER